MSIVMCIYNRLKALETLQYDTLLSLSLFFFEKRAVSNKAFLNEI